MIYVDETRCTGCGECVEVCPTDAIRLERGVAVVDQAECTECEVCLGACPEGAILSVSEPVAEEAGLPAVRPAPEVIRIRVPPLAPLGAGLAERRASEVATVPWRTRVLPVVGAALAFVGRELPRIVPAVLDALERRATRQPEVPARDSTEPISAGRGRGGRGGRRHRQRRRRR